MITIQASEFKAKSLALMDQVANTGETIVISKHGKPVAQLLAYRVPRVKSIIGIHSGKLKVSGDILAPISGTLWDALK